MNKIVTILCLVLLVFDLNAQSDDYPYPSLSPKGTITQIVGNTTIEIEYERPSVRKRSIFGHLVPWNKVWRTGAGHCTKIKFDRDVRVGDQEVKAGKYSLFTIPNPTEWVVILNRDTTLYGSYNYDPSKDIARFIVLPEVTNRFYETLTFDIDLIPNDARIYLSWTNTQIHFFVQTDTDSQLQERILRDLVSHQSKETNLYAGAAEYLYFKGSNLMQALDLADYAVKLDPSNGWARSLKIKLFERLKLYDQALSEIELYRKYTQTESKDDPLEKKRTMQELQSIEDRIQMHRTKK